MEWPLLTTFPFTITITITIASTADNRLRAETPAGPVEAASMGELGERLKELFDQLDAGLAAQEREELADLSRSATDQATLLALARSSPPLDSWFDEEDDRAPAD
jgi:hypothetical protein